METVVLFKKIIENHFSDKEKNWINQKLLKVEQENKPKEFYLAFTGAHRFLSRDEINFDEQEIIDLKSKYQDFISARWTHEQLGRLILMLVLPVDQNHQILEDFFSAADMKELVVLYRGLFLLKNANNFVARAIEGIRTNMISVFDAIALNNPFAAHYFTEEPWNQMVLKAIFMQRPLYKIVGLDNRRNEDLARIARDFAHERWSAGRIVSPELWRLCAPYVDQDIFQDLIRVIEEDTDLAKEAALRCFQECSYPKALDWISKHPTKNILKSWLQIGQEWETLESS